MQTQFGSRVLVSLGLTCLTVILAVFLAVGITYGRYSTLIQGQMALTAAPAPTPSLYSTDGEGNVIDYAPQWASRGGEQYHTFLLRNADLADEQPPKQDVRVRIRVFVSDNSDLMGALSFTLSVNGGSPLSSAGGSYLGVNTPYYTADQAEGWVYEFYQTDAEGGMAAEYIHTFRGGTFAMLPVTVTVQNTTIDCSSLRICVERVAESAM